MIISRVHIYAPGRPQTGDEEDPRRVRLLAFADVEIDYGLRINSVRILQRSDGVFIDFPSHPACDPKRCDGCGRRVECNARFCPACGRAHVPVERATYNYTVNPMNREIRNIFHNAVVNEYRRWKTVQVEGLSAAVSIPYAEPVETPS